MLADEPNGATPPPGFEWSGDSRTLVHAVGVPGGPPLWGPVTLAEAWAIAARRRPVARPPVFAFEVWTTCDPHVRTIINQRTRDRARYEYFVSVRDWCQGLRFIEVRGRKLGAPVTTHELAAVLKERQRPDLRAGVGVVHDGRGGVVVDACGGYVAVLFDHADWQMPVHPGELTVEPAAREAVPS
jgi:hypothetical protein